MKRYNGKPSRLTAIRRIQRIEFCLPPYLRDTFMTFVNPKIPKGFIECMGQRLDKRKYRKIYDALKPRTGLFK